MGKNKGPDTFIRMNYLFQASQQLLKDNPAAKNLSAFYIKTMKTISTRTQSKMNPSVKRSICKQCNMPLMPGLTSTVRLKSCRVKHLVVKCKNCNKVKRFLSKGYTDPLCDKKADETEIKQTPKK